MLYRNCLALTALATCLISPATAYAKAWTQPRGDGYAKVWLRGIVGSNAYTADGHIEESRSYRDISLRHYVEYGLTDEWTALAHGTPAGFAAFAENSTAYVGPLAVGIRRALSTGPFRVAAEAHYGYAPPVGDDDLAQPSEPLAPRSPVSYRPTVPTHFVAGELQTGYGLGWGWTVMSAGVQWNSADDVDTAVTGFAQFGVKLTRTVLLAAHLALYEPLGEVEQTNISGAGQTRYLGFGLTGSWWVTERFGLSAGIDGAVYAESNAATPSFSVGVEGRF